MQRSVDIGTGLYGAGLYLAQWTMVAGHPRCIHAPLILADADPHAVARVIALNGAVAAICARAEAVEVAATLAVQHPPPATVWAACPDGEPVEVDNPAHAAWVAAGQIVADAAGDDDLQLLLRTRADALALDAGGVAEAGWSLSLPPVPDLDPLTQTAQWDGAAWTVRVLTMEEGAVQAERLRRLLQDTDKAYQPRWHEDVRDGQPPHASESQWREARAVIRARLQSLTTGGA